ncbi:hypothetical protein [Streptomyces muensis]|uniref:Uncharacterized protein n=1 Tax=Streptomyces muensis TaxID=1077944 RepID=A0A9X1PX57_STRM4|nr:hypothetical protein [Streptomyces muensis]MCF1595125.1 hypothetical protein [Streptomyces muensis]
MGEQQSGGGTPGRRRAHPDGLVPGRAAGPHMTLDAAALEALLSAAVLRGHRADLDGEQRAVAAYRAARAAGVHHRARTRRRDDWRPRAPRRVALSVKTTLSLFVASLALGGVAVAAIGSSDSSDHPADDKVGSTPTAGAPDRPSAGPSAAQSDPRGGRPGHPTAAQDTEAKCRAYDQVEGNGQALDSTAWQRLVTAAGGEDKVAAYCAEQLARAARTEPTKPEPAKTEPAKPEATRPEPTKPAPTRTADVGGGASGDNGQGSSGRNTSGEGAEKPDQAEKQADAG